ncbi:MAG: tRNA pseudouridine(13) synthase TruD [candidate division WOR-3 bacterium]
MKIKVQPEDFKVEEIIDIQINKDGPYTLLKLQKRYWNTLDVIDFVARKLSVSKKNFSRAGLKDRYSLSIQYLSFRGDFTRTVEEKNFRLEPVGKIPKPISPDSLCGNKFAITLRDLNDNEIGKIKRNYPEVIDYGLPNYFDEQRFGSARHRQGFFAKFLMRGHYRGALKSLLCFPYKEDSRSLKFFKKTCAENWGNWDKCLKVSPVEFRKILFFLRENPNDCKNAIKMIDRDMLNLYLLAYQSYLFNKVLSSVVKECAEGVIEVPYSMGSFLFYRKLRKRDFVAGLKIPMLTEKVDMSGFLGKAIRSVLDSEMIQLKDFKLSKMRFRGVRFKSFLRSAIIFPKDFLIGRPQDDEIYKNKRKILLNFWLPPGAYATTLIKRLMI